MKDKIKRFFIDKKELLVFIAVVVVVFATVITIATLALNDTPVVGDDPVVNPGDDDDDPTQKPEDPDDNNPVDLPKAKFAVPVKGEYEMVRIFFDLSLSDEELVSAIISTGSYMIESKGVSYAKSDNSVFDVCSIYDGKVTSVEEDELDGVCVTIRHADGVESIYSSLSDVSVKVNDTIKLGQTIGKASTSLTDVEAGVHVHLEVKVNDAYVNPTTVFGKELSEVQVGK
ncbi:MAG: M23 family metallopeptidase [Acholeplasmatales bacterium]|nr:M23 family metallopeptidase [Acholeplasmatales bacterium]